MYELNDYVVYRLLTVCKVDGIETPPFEHDPTKKYYKLSPIFDNKYCTTIYVPQETTEGLRPVLTKQEAEKLIRAIPQIKPTLCMVKKPPQVTAFYQEILSSCDLKQYIALVKEVAQKIKTAKKISEIDMRFYGKTERLLCEELALSLSSTPEEVKILFQNALS